MQISFKLDFFALNMRVGKIIGTNVCVKIYTEFILGRFRPYKRHFCMRK